MKISFIRGAYLNNFEGQNYNLPLVGYSSLFPLDRTVSFPLIRLPSLADLQRISLLNIPIKFIANRTLGDSQIMFGLEQRIGHSDIVHIADPHYYYSFQAAKLRARGKIKKLICTWWETIPFNNEGTSAKKRIKEYTMNQVDLFITYSAKAKMCLEKEGVPSKKIHMIPLGIDIAIFHPQPESKSKVFTILFVGRLVEEKGILDLYDAFKIILKSESNIVLRIIGSGPLENTLNSAIKKDGLLSKISIETMAYRDIPQAYQQAHVLCVPSKTTETWEEQYGMVFIEAMASGLPIVSYNTGAISEVVGEAGLLAQEGDVAGLATMIIRIIRERELGVKLGTIGRERAEDKFDAEKTAAKIKKVYMSLRGIL